MELVIPKHIAIIMDGNGRWAKKNGKIRLEGHRQGALVLEKTIEHSIKIGVKYLRIKEPIPILEVEQVAFLSNGQIFEYSKSRHRGDKTEIKMIEVR